MDGLLDDIWTTRDLPVLVAAVRLLDEQPGLPRQAGEIAELTGLPEGDVQKALHNLATDYLDVADWGSLAGHDFVAVGFTSNALRATGAWPSPELAADRLLAALGAAIDNATEGSPKQSRLKAIRDGFVAAGRDITVEVAAAVLTGRIPL